MLLNINYYYFNKILQGRLCIWSLSFTQYFNLIHSFSFELIWPLTFHCHVNLILAILLDGNCWCDIRQKKKKVCCNINKNFFFFWVICHISNFYPKDNGNESMIKLTWHWKTMNQIDTIERPWTKLKYSVNDRNQMCSLPNFIISNKI